MVIKASSGKAIDALIADLASGDQIRRDAAVARLTVIGARAVHRLLNVASDLTAESAVRASAFRALDAIGDPRALHPALDAVVGDDLAAAIAAIDVVRAFLGSQQGVAAIDRLSGVAVDRERPASVRVAAIRALQGLDAETLEPLLTPLRNDPDAAVASAAATGSIGSRAQTTEELPPERLLEEAAQGRFPVDAASLRKALMAEGGQASVTTLHQIVDRCRVREGSESVEGRAAWTGVRAAAHATLADRGSRLALYDLRETLESAKEPVAVEFLAAMSTIGDTSCLEPLATAYARAVAGAPAREDWWRSRLSDVFRTVAGREQITRRHAVAKKIEKRWPGAFDSLTRD